MAASADPPSAPPGAVDSPQVRRAFARAASTYDTADFLQAQVRNRLTERLDWVRMDPAVVVDLGAGTGRAAGALAARFPGADLLALDVTPAMLREAGRQAIPLAPVVADAAALPLRDGSVDVVFSSLMLHWCPSLDAVFLEVARVLRHPGLFTFTTLGPGSFAELRAAWAAADAGTHVMAFPEMQALGDGLLRAGLTEPVLDTDSLTVRYADLEQLTGDLRLTGTANRTSGRRRGLTGRHVWQRMCAAYEAFRDPGGRLPVTLEIICGQAWAPGAGKGRPRHGPAEIPLVQLHRRRPADRDG